MAREVLKSKICLVGDLAVGKSSLISRYVLNVFDDKYLTTLGTKVSKKSLDLDFPAKDLQVRADLLIWDIMGQHGFQELLKDAYFFGVRGILAVCDLTRKETLANLDTWVKCVESVAGKVPMLLVLNKADLQDRAAITQADIEEASEAYGCEALRVSAKTGLNIEVAFRKLATLVAEAQLESGEMSE